jgi:hypothetical protein
VVVALPAWPAPGLRLGGACSADTGRLSWPGAEEKADPVRAGKPPAVPPENEAVAGGTSAATAAEAPMLPAGIMRPSRFFSLAPALVALASDV